MTLRILVALCWFARYAPALEPSCQPVEGDRVLGKDLAAALPVFRALPPETWVGNMPPPGSHRTFHAAELISFAAQHSIKLDSADDICFEWPMEPLDSGRVLQAMRESLKGMPARIEITEISRQAVPRGKLEFAREMLGRPASPAQENPVLWRGEVVYGGNHRYAVWAKVRVMVPCQRIISLGALKPGQRIEAQQIHAESGECFPRPEGASQMREETMLGMTPTRLIPAGAEVFPEFLARPNDVNRGDAVQVDVRSGGAHLAFTAKAESAGRTGDFIAVLNPSSNKTFRAQVKDKGHVVVVTDSTAAGQ